MQVIQLDIITFSRALVSLGEAIAGFGRAIVDPDALEGQEGQDEAVTYGEGEFSEEAYDQEQPEGEPVQEPEPEPEPDAEPEAEPEQEHEAETEEVPEPETEPEPEPKPIRKKAEKKDKAPNEDRIDAIRRVARKLGMAPAQEPHAGRPRKEKAMGQRPMEKYVEEYLRRPAVKEIRSSGPRYVGSDYLLDGRDVSLEKLFNDGHCIVGIKGTRYFRTARIDDLSDLYPAPSLPKYCVKEPKVGMEVYVGFGEKDEKVARSFRFAKISGIRDSGMADVVYSDSGTTGTCRLDQLSTKPSRK